MGDLHSVHRHGSPASLEAYSSIRERVAEQHAKNECRRCMFWNNNECRAGMACEYCHAEHVVPKRPGKTARARKKRRSKVAELAKQTRQKEADTAKTLQAK